MRLPAVLAVTALLLSTASGAGEVSVSLGTRLHYGSGLPGEGSAPGGTSVPGEGTDVPSDWRRPSADELALVSSLDARTELLEAGAGTAGGESARDNPVLMSLASLAVPGTGQLLQGNSRGYAYLAAEVLLWGGFYLLEKDGLDERDRYETFADDHWNFVAYSNWYATECAECQENGDCEDAYLCRPLAEYGTQEYYEDIGKYETYWRWWDLDGTEDDPETGWRDFTDADVDLRNAYYDMRKDSNRSLEHARYAMMAALLNHVVSAVDAFLTSRAGTEPHTDSGSDLGFEFDVADGGGGLRCALTTRY